MDTNTLFIIAAQRKYRFASERGPLMVENLFDLPLDSKNGFSLNAVAIQLDQDIEKQGKRSFVATKSNPAKVELENKLAVVVAVIAIKEEEQKKAELRAARSTELRRLLDAREDAKAKELGAASVDELEKRIAELQAAGV